MSVQITVSGLNRLQRVAEQWPAISEKYINAAINTGLVRVLGEEKVQAPFGVSGLLRDNWQISTGRFEGSLTSLAPYAASVEYGSAPHMPPIASITPWANKKGLNPWAVAMSIKKNGTKANPFLQRAADNSVDGLESDFAKALQSTVDEAAALSDD